MTAKFDIEAIRARQRELAEEIDQLQKEAEELNVALRVLQRFSPFADTADTKLGPRRPVGTPTLFEMTEAVIIAAEKQGKRGLAGREIVEQIGERYWPGVNGAQILPSIYQFAKKDRLKKTKEGRFLTVKQNAPEVGASSASGD